MSNDKIKDFSKRLRETRKAMRDSGGKEVNTAAMLDDLEKGLQPYIDARIQKGIENTVFPYENGTNSNYNGVNLGKNPYAHIVKDIVGNGYFKSGSKVYKVGDMAMIYKMLQDNKPSEMADTKVIERHKKDVKHLHDVVKALKPYSGVTKFFRSDIEAQGGALTPRDTMEMLWQDFYMPSRILGMIPRSNISTSAADNTRVMQMLTDDRWRKVTPGQAPGVQTPLTDDVTFKYTLHALEYAWDYDWGTDTIIDEVPVLRQRIISSHQRLVGAFLINADSTVGPTGNINSDDANPDPSSYYLANGVNGIVKKWLVDAGTGVDASGGALTTEFIADAMIKLGKYYDSPNVGIVTNLAGWLRMQLLPEVVLIRQEANNPMIVAAELGRYLGKPIIIDQQQLNAEVDGRVSATAANNTFGRISVVDFSRWMLALRGLLIESGKDIHIRQHQLVASARVSMVDYGTRNETEHTSGVYGFKLTA